MTENDYIAEYIKERHPDILGINFAVWKLQRQLLDTAQNIVQVFQSDEFMQVLRNAAESEGKDYFCKCDKYEPKEGKKDE